RLFEDHRLVAFDPQEARVAVRRAVVAAAVRAVAAAQEDLIARGQPRQLGGIEPGLPRRARGGKKQNGGREGPREDEKRDRGRSERSPHGRTPYGFEV